MTRPLACLLLAAALAGCGGDEEAAAPVESPPRATETPTPTPTATPTASATATPPPTPTATPAPEDQPGGAGDEEEIRVPVELTVLGDTVTPPQVSVPAFLALELIVHNESPQTLEVTLEGAPPLAVPAGETARQELDGRRPGEYLIDTGVAGDVLLVTGAEPGP